METITLAPEIMDQDIEAMQVEPATRRVDKGQPTAAGDVSRRTLAREKLAPTNVGGYFVTGPVPATQAALDYQRIERAIGYLQAHFAEQPDLAAVASAAHLSEYHFQRVFSRWAG